MEDKRDIPRLSEIKLLDEEHSVTNKKGNIFEVPSKEIISYLQNTDNRVEYYGYDTPPLELNLSAWFNEHVSIPLAKQVLADFPEEKTVYARAIACSVNGSIDFNNLHIRDIREVLLTGVEQANSVMAATGAIGRYNNGELMSDWMIWHYLFNGARSIRNMLPEDLGARIFPALLVYNNEGASKLASYHAVPESEKSGLVQKAYILPYLGYKS
jgi:hypothetical protein